MTPLSTQFFLFRSALFLFPSDKTSDIYVTHPRKKGGERKRANEEKEEGTKEGRKVYAHYIRRVSDGAWRGCTAVDTIMHNNTSIIHPLNGICFEGISRGERKNGKTLFSFSLEFFQ